MTALANGSSAQMVVDRRPTAILASQLGIDRETMINTLMATIMPSATNEEVAAFCIVSSKYGLNPFTKEIYAYPKKGGGIQPVVGIDGWVTLINRQEDLDGLEFDEQVDTTGKPISTTCRIYIKGRSKPVTITEWFDECVRNTDPWKQMPRRMLRHKALIQAARVAFGLSGISDEDEGRDVVQSSPKGSTTDTIRQLAARQSLPDTQLPDDEAAKKIESDANRNLEEQRTTAQDQPKQEAPAPKQESSDPQRFADWDTFYARMIETNNDLGGKEADLQRAINGALIACAKKGKQNETTPAWREEQYQALTQKAGRFAYLAAKEQ